MMQGGASPGAPRQNIAEIGCAHDDGRIGLLIGEGDNGQGAPTVLSMFAAEELGVDVERLIVDNNLHFTFLLVNKMGECAQQE